MGMRLGFHYHIPAEQRADGIYTPGYLGRFIDSLAIHCEQVVCFQHSPRSSQRAQLDYRMLSKNIQLVDLGPHCSVPRRTLLSGKYAQLLNAWRGQLDAMLCRGPSPLTPAFATKARSLGIPTALLIVGSNVEGIDDLPQARWRKELIRALNHFNQWRLDRAAITSLTFVNSRKLYDQYQGKVPLLVETRTTTLSEQDFFARVDTCQEHPTRLLYTGRFDRAKGLLEIVEALALLVAEGHDLVLDLVGWDDSGTGVEAELQTYAKKLGVADRVFNHGRKAVGPELFDFYCRADIYVIASKSNFEGFPRTIWEAMAHSLPVVATRVGSIPQFLNDAAELVAPADVPALVEGLRHVLADTRHRRGLITKGLQLARQNTLEKLGVEMVERLKIYVMEGR